jgi:putative ABC transport system ATP-binding protein
MSLATRDLTLLRQSGTGAERAVLSSVSVEFPAGSVSLIGGAVGSGKSTLLHTLATLLRPSAGEVLADGEPVSRWSPAHRERWRRQVGVAFQTPHLFEELSVLENVMAPLIPRGGGLGWARERAEQALERLGLTPLAGRGPGGLSGGERQRVVLARAEVGAPRFLLADEPTAHQDPDGLQLVLRALAEARARGAVVIVVAHDARVVRAGVVDHRWTLRGGRLEASEPAP